MEAWGNERQNCEDTGQTSTTHKDMCDKQEAKMADSRDTKWVEKPFTPNIWCYKEIICSTEQREVLYPWLQKELVSCFFYFPHRQKTCFSNQKSPWQVCEKWLFLSPRNLFLPCGSRSVGFSHFKDKLPKFPPCKDSTLSSALLQI